MLPRLSIPLLALSLMVPGPAGAEGKPQVDVSRLLGRLRPVYAQSTSFSPSAMRFPLRTPSYEEVVQAKQQAEEKPEDVELRRKAAFLAEAAEDSGATAQWSLALGLVEAKVRSGKVDLPLLERQVEALVGANLGNRVVPIAERLLKMPGGTWRTQLLAGDAYFRRADFNWRVLVRRSAAKDLPPAFLIQMNGDLDAAQKAYDRAVELAPAEAGPRAGRMALAMARPIMAGLLPKGVIPQAKLDVLALRRDLLELIQRNPGKVAPVWHTAHFFATQAPDEAPMSQSERMTLERALTEAKAQPEEAVFVIEARGLLHAGRREWSEAAKQFEAALKTEPQRRFAAEWLAVSEANSPEPQAAVIERVRGRIAATPRSQDYALLGVLLADRDPAAAVEALRKAIDLDVNNAIARYNLGMLLLRAKPDTIEGRHHLRRALQLRSDDSEAQFAFALSLAADHQIAEARRVLEAVLAVPEIPKDLRDRAATTLQELSPPATPTKS